ncbi:MAG: polysaccharide biosynthesis protein [Oscillospiraceae bacterium]|nr:polysaccharide biosynthesis protein [Oscillospiraceae bacterium]
MKNRIKGNLRRVVFCLCDCIFISLAYIAAISLFSYLALDQLPGPRQGYLSAYVYSIPFQILGVILFFIPLGLYRDMLRHISLLELLRMLIGSVFATLIPYLAMGYYMVSSYDKMVLTNPDILRWPPPIILVTAFYLFITMTGLVRLSPVIWKSTHRYYNWLKWGHDKRVPTLIVGAGTAAAALLKDFQLQGKDCRYLVVGIIDDNPGKHNRNIRSVRILGGSDMIPNIVKKHGIMEIIIAIPSATPDQMRKLISVCAPTGCAVHTMKKVTTIEEAKVTSLQNLDVSDLLWRREAVLCPNDMASYITNRCVLVTGGGGSIGSELCRQILRFDPQMLVIYDFYENNAYDLAQELRIRYPDKAENVVIRIGSIQDKCRLDEVFAETRPSVVFHAAAYKHVPLMEECPELAIKNNVFGTYNTALCSQKHSVRRFVMISTDKAVNPTNVMGASKRLAEIILQSMNGRGVEFVAVRFGNVLGSNGSVVPVFRRQIESGGPVTVMHPEIIRYFMTITEAVSLVLQAGAMANGGETFLLDMGDPVKIVDLARTMIEMAGLTPGRDIDIEFTGLRPGEKLYEELLINAEYVMRTDDEKIFIANAPIPGEQERAAILMELERVLAEKGDIKASISKLLPEYTRHDIASEDK